MCVHVVCSVTVWWPLAEMTTDQDLPIDAKSATAAFAAKGIDLTSNKDQGVIKVFTYHCFRFEHFMVRAYCLTMIPVSLSKRRLWWIGNLAFVFVGCEVSRIRWRSADDWGQSDCPLHWKAAHGEEVWLQSRSQRAFLLQCGQRWMTSWLLLRLIVSQHLSLLLLLRGTAFDPSHTSLE